MFGDCWRQLLSLIWHERRQKHSVDVNQAQQIDSDLLERINTLATFLWSDSSSSQNEVLVTQFGIKIHRRDFRTLANEQWLNDEVINLYMRLIVQRSQLDCALPMVYAFNSFFFLKLWNSGHQGVHKWTKDVDIFCFEILLIPIHLGSHWALAVVYTRDRLIDYLDSLHADNPQCLQVLSQYLLDEAMAKNRNHRDLSDLSDWTKVCRKDIPRQSNSSDCGVFSCAFANLISSGRSPAIPDLGQQIPFIRRRMAFEIYHGTLI